MTNAEKNLYRKYRKEKIHDNVIVFESLWGRSYSCNPAAFYEYIDRLHPEYECVWLLNDTDVDIPGRAKKVMRGTAEHRYYLATAKYFVFNTNMPRSFKKRDGQVIVHTMHGTPFKAFGLDVKEETDTEEKRLRVIERSSMWDYLVAQGEFTKNMAWRWFRYGKTVLEIGYPRTDELFLTDDCKQAHLRSDIGIPERKRVILYAPTWRNMNSFEMKLNIDRMREALSDDYVLLIRLHHFDSEFYELPADGSFVFDAGGINDIEELFAITDVLITDYSSIMFDFALTEKPMVFYTYDLEDYTGENRGCYFDLAREAPGAIAMTTEEVIAAIRGDAGDEKAPSDRTKEFRKKYLTYENPNSCEKLYDEVFVKHRHVWDITWSNRVMHIIKHVLPGRLYLKIKRRQLRKLAETTSPPVR